MLAPAKATWVEVVAWDAPETSCGERLLFNLLFNERPEYLGLCELKQKGCGKGNKTAV